MIVGTRGSNLAIAQTDDICNLLSKITDEKIDKTLIKTKGDKITDSQLYNMDSKGLFTKELDKVVLEEEVDFAVHSLKDVPTDLDEDLKITAIPLREPANEVLISNKKWDELKKGDSLGSSSLRREAFCKHYNKEFELKPIRGNIETRINKVLNGDVDATIMAQAGLNRLNLEKHIQMIFPIDYIYPAAGQGAIAVISRKDSEKNKIIEKINHNESYQTATAEKTVLKEIGVGCQWPLGVTCQIKNKKLELKSILLDKNGEVLYKNEKTGSINDASKLGIEIGQEMLEFL
ncbi:MAG: hydroxymethylbilane synthase [Romboutsia sp.]|nr:hydroxymethylbilane synthase [Romboutsia sp.]